MSVRPEYVVIVAGVVLAPLAYFFRSSFLMDPSKQNLATFYHQAWGQEWPNKKGTIFKADIVEDELAEDSADEADDDGDEANNNAGKARANAKNVSPALDVSVLEKFDYIYYPMDQVTKVFGRATAMESVLVVRGEYINVLKMLFQREERAKPGTGVVVTGHPGTGKTTFLFYVLLYRLQRRLPTAIQLDDLNYYIFDSQGATIHLLSEVNMRLESCWALVDSNDLVSRPCAAFRKRAKFLVQATSPKPERWLEWNKQARGKFIVMDLPKVQEIAAISKELNLDTPEVFRLVCTWGPSIRWILNILQEPKDERIKVEATLRVAATSAAKKLFDSPGFTSAMSEEVQLPFSEGSNILFLRPKYIFSGSVDAVESVSFIPTDHLCEIFESKRLSHTNEESLKLFAAFSTHALTRTAAGWGHELKMHYKMCTTTASIRIFRENDEQQIQPSGHLLAGTLPGLKTESNPQSFYWIPSAGNFPGIDSVLCYDNNLYLTQATIAGEHQDPVKGLRKVWANTHRNIQALSWHLVIVTANPEVANEYVKKWSEKLEGFRLGRVRRSVTVWGCVLM